MLRRTPPLLPRTRSLLPRQRCLSTTISTKYATPSTLVNSAWDKLKPRARTTVPASSHDQDLLRLFTNASQQLRDSPNQESTKVHASTHMRACTVLTSHPQATSLTQLLDRIPEFPSDHSDSADFVLLVTPSYASTLHRQKDAIEKALTRIYPLKDLDQPKEALRLAAAVVDRLPSPSESHAVTADIGSEGIALMLNHGDKSEHVPVFSTEPRAKTLADNFCRCLSFDFPDASSLKGVQLPLANTIFQNGLPQTLIWRKWLVQPGGKVVQETEEKLCDSYRVDLPLMQSAQSPEDFFLSLPLVPLTPGRAVVACMGNIIRRLSSSPGIVPNDSGKEAILASQELELAVTAYHKSRNLSPRPVSVWALVIPADSFSGGQSMAADALRLTDLPETWTKDLSDAVISINPSLLDLIRHGARLHKVLSGGGGWGKKAGLLSLDPDTGYAKHETPMTFDMLMASKSSDPEELRSIVNKGDFIQFFISPTASNEDVPAQSLEGSQSSVQRDANTRSAEFGTIPSTIDDIPSTETAGTEAKDTVKVFENHFGALSERGIAMFYGGDDKSPVLPSEPATKVDVPFGRFRYQAQVRDESTPKSKAGEGFAPTKPRNAHMSSRTLCRRTVLDKWRPITTIQRRSLLDRSLCSTGQPSQPARHDQVKGGLSWQSARETAMTPRQLRKIQRVPKLPNKNWTSKDIRNARKALRDAKIGRTIGEDREKLPSLDGVSSALNGDQDQTTPPSQVLASSAPLHKAESSDDFAALYLQSSKTRRIKVFANQGMKDVISPGAYQDWIKKDHIPKLPNSIWTSKDIHAAFNFLIRQGSLEEDFKLVREKRVNTVTVFRQLNADNSSGQELASEAIEDPAIVTALKEQAQARARTRILRAAFRGVLPPEQEQAPPSKQSTKPHLANPASQSKEPLNQHLKHRIDNLITISESSPRITIYELMNATPSSPLKPKDTGKQKKEKMLRELLRWRSAATELKDALKEEFPREEVRRGWKRAVKGEIEEIDSVEESVNKFLKGFGG